MLGCELVTRQQSTENADGRFKDLWLGIDIEGHPFNDIANGVVKADRIVQHDEGVQHIDQCHGEVACDVIRGNVRPALRVRIASGAQEFNTNGLYQSGPLPVHDNGASYVATVNSELRAACQGARTSSIGNA